MEEIKVYSNSCIDKHFIKGFASRQSCAAKPSFINVQVNAFNYQHA